MFSGLRPDADRYYEVGLYLCSMLTLQGLSQDAGDALIERGIHVAPQPLVEGISQRDAVMVKETLERRGAKVRIKEGVVRRPDTRREAIPARVREEVWRRDGGRCVDCGSRERLEYGRG
jgi:hypothetical protein